MDVSANAGQCGDKSAQLQTAQPDGGPHVLARRSLQRPDQARVREAVSEADPGGCAENLQDEQAARQADMQAMFDDV